MALVRQQVVDAIVAKLQAITLANSYTRNVGTDRVFLESEIPQNAPTPSILILEGEELVDFESTQNYTCTLPLTIGYTDRVRSNEKGNEVAAHFMGEIQKAMGVDFQITVDAYSGGTTTLTGNMYETSNATVVDQSRVYGEVEYNVEYVRNIKDPNKV